MWHIVAEWDFLAQKTVGGQFIRSVDSISANIAEGFGRYTKKDKSKFFRYGYSSAFESLDWNQKAKDRGLISAEQYDHILRALKVLPKEINAHIKLTQAKLTK